MAGLGSQPQLMISPLTQNKNYDLRAKNMDISVISAIYLWMM